MTPLRGPGQTPSWRPRNPLTSFQHAVDGVGHAFRTQRNMRFHILVVLGVLLFGLVLRLPRFEMIALLFAASLVLMAELFNTAVEAVVDMITQSYHPAAKFAKDIAAGAVLIAAINAGAVGLVVFAGNLRLDLLKVRTHYPPTFLIMTAAFLLMLVILFLGKMLGKKGTLFQGGAISGHSAIAFFIAGTILYSVESWPASVLALALAALVGQARVEAKIHTLREVVLGAVLALALTSVIYRMPNWLGRLLPPATSVPADGASGG
jgi:diacylglycerol kinase (ATP)